MTTIWKFVLPAPDERGVSIVSMPRLSATLSVGIQGDEMVVWALAETAHALVERKFFVLNTGAEFDQLWLPDKPRFVGTVTTDNGIVWHIWEQTGVTAQVLPHRDLGPKVKAS